MIDTYVVILFFESTKCAQLACSSLSDVRSVGSDKKKKYIKIYKDIILALQEL